MATQLHAVCIPFAAQGHITPMMEISKRLASSFGFRITFVIIEHHYHKLLRSQSEAGIPLPSQVGLDIRLVGIPDGLPPDHSRGADALDFLSVVDRSLEPALDELMRKLMKEELPPSFIISDAHCSWSQGVANRYGLPRVVLWTSSASGTSAYIHIPHLMSEGHLPVTEGDKQHNLITSLPGFPPLLPRDLPSFLHFKDTSDFFYQFFRRHCSCLKDAAWILLNSCYELEGPVIDGMFSVAPTYPIGPLLPSAFFDNSGQTDLRYGTGLWREENMCLQWLDTHSASSVLYVSFGSIASMSLQQVEELALGLEASQIPFLWAIRPEFVDFTARSFLEQFSSRNKDRCLLVPWAPQLLVLSHSAVGGFLTHCGWNSTMESICMGVPLLGWPYFAEQSTNLKFIVDVWKVGLEVKAREDGFRERAEVEKGVRLLMQRSRLREEMQERVMKLGEAAVGAWKDGGSSYANLKAFVEGMKRRCVARRKGEDSGDGEGSRSG